MLISSTDLQINELCSFCKFVASFPGVLTVSRTQICFKNLGKKVQLLCLCSQFFFSSFELYITMYLGKFTLPRIPSHDNKTLFLAHWVGNFSTISLNQICCVLSLDTFQDSRNNKCQSIQTVFHFLKIKLSSACIIQDEQRKKIILPLKAS